jgi:hypothetical protein
MRDTHEGMPELLSAYEREGPYFGLVAVTSGGETRHIEFGVQPDGYSALRRVLQSRPFDKLPGIRYRYFIAHAVFRASASIASVDMRIEQDANGRQFPFEVPIGLAQNLLWFADLKDFNDAAHLRTILPENRSA